MKYPHIQQHDSSDCAVACVASVCSFYKREITIVKLREILGTDMAGTTVKGIADAADKLGFEAKAVRVDPASFKNGGFTLPAIARIVRRDGTAHFIVVYSISKGGEVDLVNGMTVRTWITYEKMTYLKYWMDQLGLGEYL